MLTELHPNKHKRVWLKYKHGIEGRKSYKTTWFSNRTLWDKRYGMHFTMSLSSILGRKSSVLLC